MSTTQTEVTVDFIARAQAHVTRLVTAMGFGEAHVTCTLPTTDTSRLAGKRQLNVAIEAGETGRLLIGTHGEHLYALQHIVRSVLCCQMHESLYITVDVNGYVAYRERSLQQLAEHAARKAQGSGRAVVLRPMTAFERRIIHTALATRSDVRTESLGEEPNRRVIIKPVFM